jgi:cyclophilin family peptidyl-prolyl cis-trans isomerase
VSRKEGPVRNIFGIASVLAMFCGIVFGADTAHPPIKNEAGKGLKNDRGTIAMARTGVVDSATAQFFINVVNNDFLNHVDGTPRGFGYAVFGKVIEGMDVVDKIRAVPTGRVSMSQDVPKDAVTILRATVVDK